MNFEEAKAWYDGYDLIAHRQTGDEHYSMYSPKSVVEAMLRHKYEPYWDEQCIDLPKVSVSGLKEAIEHLLDGKSVPINIGTFCGDVLDFSNRYDVLTLLTHFGYLTYNETDETVKIPNKDSLQKLSTIIGKPPYRTISIDDMNLSIRAYNCLTRAGVKTTDDLVTMTEEEIFGIRNLGRKSSEEVINRLNALGYSLKNEKMSSEALDE